MNSKSLSPLSLFCSQIDNGFAEDVVLEAKTTGLARHYEKDFGAIWLPVFESSAPRYLIADEAAKRIFFTYLA